ncbi:MAG: ion transporter [Bacteroidia bacterium]|nr:ion transporter [Bacteroidia bacterium]NND51555.1 ion transporter [Flavobacteriaceae bacterium]
MNNEHPKRSWRTRLHIIIYGTNTPAGKLFDIILLTVILASIVLVMLESIKEIDEKYHTFLDISEWIVTILFTIEYIARIITVKKPLRYITSFYGIVDFLSTIPKYLSLLIAGTHALVALRALRMLRVFRILKLGRYVESSNTIVKALRASRTKISVFLFGVFIVSIILGTIMYIIEGDESGFTSIPRGIYWCIVTLTTVGYGDISPVTPLGQFIASIVMIMGYGIIAVPTGIVTAEIATQPKRTKNDKPIPQTNCFGCGEIDHRKDAEFCYNCGHTLKED